MKVALIAKKKESECQSLMALTLLDLIFFFTFASRSLSCSRSWDYRFSSLADCRWISVKRGVDVFERCHLLRLLAPPASDVSRP